MLKNIDADRARDMLLDIPVHMTTETVKLEDSYGRVLAEDVHAAAAVPGFDRSPYDGYAFRGEDTAGASKDTPVVLEITEEIPAGKVPTIELTPGKAAKILTGAPLPNGSNATIKYEITEFTDKYVKIFEPVKPNTDIIYAGEDIKKGELVAPAGSIINAPMAGILASIGISEPLVYKMPVVTIINTGTELIEVGNPLTSAKIYNSNVYTLMGYLSQAGMTALNGGVVDDEPELIADAITAALEKSDLVITTGGSSVGDYDFAVESVEKAGAEVLFWKVNMKPGGAMVASVKDGKLILGLSGSPGAAILGLFRIAMPFIRKSCGRLDIIPETIDVFLEKPYKKTTDKSRLIRGKLIVRDGKALFSENYRQGNSTISSFYDCDLIAELPAGTPPQPGNTVVKAYVFK